MLYLKCNIENILRRLSVKKWILLILKNKINTLWRLKLKWMKFISQWTMINPDGVGNKNITILSITHRLEPSCSFAQENSEYISNWIWFDKMRSIVMLTYVLWASFNIIRLNLKRRYYWRFQRIIIHYIRNNCVHIKNFIMGSFMNNLPRLTDILLTSQQCFFD